MPYLLFLIVCFVWGSSFILMDRATHALGPITIALCRLLGGSLVLLICWLWNRQSVRLRLVDWGHLSVVAFFAFALPFVIQPYTMIQTGEHAYFGMMVVLVPLATILVSIPMLGIWPTSRQLVGVLGGIACMALIVQDGSSRGFPPKLLALALLVPITYAIGNTYIKWKLSHLSTLPLTTLMLAVGAGLLIPLQLSPQMLANWELGAPEVPVDWPMAIVSILFLSVISTGIATLIFTHLIKNQGPLFAGMVTYIIPVLALLWGQFDGEKLTSTQLLAIGGVLAMVGLVQWGAATSASEEVSELDVVGE